MYTPEAISAFGVFFCLSQKTVVFFWICGTINKSVPCLHAAMNQEVFSWLKINSTLHRRKRMEVS